MNILSIQSHVAYGHVGNAAATFPLQRLGVEVWPIHTVQFSNHTGYGAWKGDVFGAGMIRDIVSGIEARGVLAECDGVLSGYMGSAEIGEAILEAVTHVKRANPAARYCCDPVIGDVGRGVFVHKDIPVFMKSRAVPAADVITPNHFELDQLSGRATKTLGRRVARHRRPACAWPAGDSRDLAAHAGNTAGLHRSHRLRPHRALPAAHAETADRGERGGRRHRGLVLSPASAPRFRRRGAELRGLRDFGVLHRTAEQGASEMLLVEAQQELVEPSRMFEAERVA